MKKILFCSDLSKNCNSLFNYIAEWVNNTDMVVDVIHSYDPDFVNIASIDVTRSPGFNTEMQNKMISNMEAFLEKLPEKNRGECHLETDRNPERAIRQTARNIKADLIVTGLRDKYTLMDKIVGSTAVRLVGDTNPPLLAIPYERTYTPIEKILFTTQSSSIDNLSVQEEEAITWIYDHLDKDSLPAIHVLHVTKDSTPISVEERTFMPMKFTTTSSTDVVMGILDYINSTPVDVIVARHQEKNLWERIHNSSVAKNLLYKAKMPILFL